MEEQFTNQIWSGYALGYFKYCSKMIEISNFDSSSDEFLSLLLRIQLGNKEIELAQLTEYVKNEEPATQALGYYAKIILEEDPERKDQFIQNIKDISNAHDLTTRFICACALQQVGEYQYALDICDNNALEMIVLKIYIFFKLGKFDSFSNSEFNIDDEDPLGKFALAWNCIAHGNYKEAYLLFEDIHAYYNNSEEFKSVIILNNKAATLMQQQLFQAALKELLIAYSLDSEDTTTLSNLICCYRNLSNNEEADKYFNLLAQYSKDNILVLKSQELSELISSFSNN